MSEHQFKNAYWLGYGDAMAEADRKRLWPKVAVVIVVAGLAFWAGRVSMRPRVTLAYETGFDAGVAEGTTKWSESK